jgi:hypothetical protein
MCDAAEVEVRENALQACGNPEFDASRRQFLQGMGVIAAGAILLPGFGPPMTDAETEWLGGY